MPQVIGSLIIGAIGVADVTLVAGLTLSSLVGTVVLTAAMIGLQFALQPDLPKPAAGHQSTRQPIPPRVWAYGRVRVVGCYEAIE